MRLIVFQTLKMILDETLVQFYTMSEAMKKRLMLVGNELDSFPNFLNDTPEENENKSQRANHMGGIRESIKEVGVEKRFGTIKEE